MKNMISSYYLKTDDKLYWIALLMTNIKYNFIKDEYFNNI